VQNTKSWEVELWQGVPGEQWECKKMEYVAEEGSQEEAILSVGRLSQKPKKHVFTLDLSRPTSGQTETRFTVKFRNESSSSWKWVNDQFNIPDGSIYWQQDSKPSNDFHYYVTGTDLNVQIKEVMPQTPDTLLWTLSFPIGPAHDENSCFANYKLGLANNFTRWFATCRLMTTWLRPRHGQDKFSIDKQQALSIAFLRHDGLSVVALALSGIDDTSMLFQEDKAGNIITTARNDGVKNGEGKVLVAVANSYEIANAAVMYHARTMSVDAQKLLNRQEDDVIHSTVNKIDAKWVEEWYDGFGYCTWNSLGQQLNEKSILEALEQFKKDEITRI